MAVVGAVGGYSVGGSVVGECGGLIVTVGWGVVKSVEGREELMVVVIVVVVG